MERKINRKGGVTIPQSMRRELGIGEPEKIDLQVQADGNILIRRIVGLCVFCGTDDTLQKFEGRFVCTACLQQLIALEKKTEAMI